MASRDDDFAEFAHARWQRLVRISVGLGATLADAEDHVQAAMLRAYVAWPRVSKAQSVDAYMYKILLNTQREAHRKPWRRHETSTSELPESTVDDFTSSVDLTGALRAALSCLNEDQREVVALRYFGGLSELEMAEVLHLPSGTIKSRLARALRRLAQDPELQDGRTGGTR
jgi:RNA polymerase sigma-70 factor (sigma-E family)